AASPELFQQNKAIIYQQFLHGKARTAIAAARALVGEAPDATEKAKLLRDVLEMCTAASEWTCVAEAIPAIAPLIRSDARLSSLSAEVALYGAKGAWSLNDTAMLDTYLSDDAAGKISLARPAIAAQLRLALHPYLLRKGDPASADQMRSAAIHDLVRSDPRE